MITTLVTVTVLAATLVAAPRMSVTHPCREAADGWMRLLFDADLPDGVRDRLGDEVHATSAAACRAGEKGLAVAPDATRPEGVPASTGSSGPDGTHPAAPMPVAALAASGPTEPAPSKPSRRGPTPPNLWEPESSSSPGSPALSLPVPPPVAVPAPRARRSGEVDESGEIGESAGGGDVRKGAGEITRRDGASGRIATSLWRPSHSPSLGRAFLGRVSLRSSLRQVSLRRASPGRTVVMAALRQVGRPYVWGGGSSTGPTGGGFDCSGLALHAWSKAGARLAHYTGSQFRQGRRVPFSRLRPGDLVFFGGGTGDPTHVGVYAGGGLMVHAPKTGDVVRTTNFAASPYYRARYRGAVRPRPGSPSS